MNNKIKNTLISVAKMLLFLALFLSLYVFTRDVLRDKKHSEALGIIMRQPDHSYDVILAGPSHIQYALQPAQLFGEYGIASCNTATAAQSVPTSYYVIKEMIERHDPELVVLDVFCVFFPEAYFSPARFHQAIDNFPLSRNKIEAIYDLAYEDRVEYILNYIIYHVRWKNITLHDFTVYSHFNETYQLLNGTTPFYESFAPVPLSSKADIPEIPALYLKKIVDLCKETNTELLLTVIPYRADVDNNSTSAVLQQQMYNTVAELAESWGVDFFNGLHYLEEMEFDFVTDMVEYSHVNVRGTVKISSFYGKYLSTRYDLPDRSSDPDYAHWYEDYESYLREVENLIGVDF